MVRKYGVVEDELFGFELWSDEAEWRLEMMTSMPIEGHLILVWCCFFGQSWDGMYIGCCFDYLYQHRFGPEKLSLGQDGRESGDEIGWWLVLVDLATTDVSPLSQDWSDCWFGLLSLTNSIMLRLASVKNITAMLNMSHWRPRLFLDTSAWDPSQLFQTTTLTLMTDEFWQGHQYLARHHNSQDIGQEDKQYSQSRILLSTPSLGCISYHTGVYGVWRTIMIAPHSTKEIYILHRRYVMPFCLVVAIGTLYKGHITLVHSFAPAPESHILPPTTIAKTNNGLLAGGW